MECEQVPGEQRGRKDHRIENGLIPRGQPFGPSEFGSKLVARVFGSILVAKRADFSGFCRLIRLLKPLPSARYGFVTSMAWKRSSVRSRPGPPFSSTYSVPIFLLGSIWQQTPLTASISYGRGSRFHPHQVHHRLTTCRHYAF